MKLIRWGTQGSCGFSGVFLMGLSGTKKNTEDVPSVDFKPTKKMRTRYMPWANPPCDKYNHEYELLETDVVKGITVWTCNYCEHRIEKPLKDFRTLEELKTGEKLKC